MITGFVLTLTPVPLALAVGLFSVFVAARLFHSVAYLYQI